MKQLFPDIPKRVANLRMFTLHIMLINHMIGLLTNQNIFFYLHLSNS